MQNHSMYTSLFMIIYPDASLLAFKIQEKAISLKSQVLELILLVA